MIYILDTTSLLSWHIPQGVNITCSETIEEIKRKFTYTVVEGYVSSGKIIVDEPGEKYVSKAEDIAKTTGDYVKLSKADICIIALALKYHEEEVNVVTDDYAIQNILKKLGIKFQSYYREIKENVEWILICSQCGKIYPPTYPNKYCEVCGGKIVRRRKRT